MNTIYIFWLRQIKKYFRSKSRIIGSLGQPLLFLFSLGFGFGAIYQKAGEGSYIQFLAPGVISMSILFTAVFTGIEIIWDRQFGFLKETLIAPVSRLNIMIGKALGGGTVAAIQGVIVFFLAFLVGFRPTNIYLLPLALVFMIIIAVFFTSLGIIIASLLKDMQGFQLIMNFILMPLFFLSGALFPLQGLPGALGFITKIDPLSYGVDGLRGALASASYFGIFLDFSVLSIITVFALALGGYFFSKIEI